MKASGPDEIVHAGNVDEDRALGAGVVAKRRLLLVKVLAHHAEEDRPGELVLQLHSRDVLPLTRLPSLRRRTSCKA